MSIVFKPKIAFHFGSGKAGTTKVVPRESRMWTEKSINTLVALRALLVTYQECSAIVGHSPSSCKGIITYHHLFARIAKKRKELIEEAGL